MATNETPYFDGHQKPERPGPYKRDMGNGQTHFSNWNGEFWCTYDDSAEKAVQQDRPSWLQNLPWCGLASQPE